MARGQEIAKIKNGIVVFLGITQGDNEEIAKKMVNKPLKLRIWPEIPKTAPKVNGAERNKSMTKPKKRSQNL